MSPALFQAAAILLFAIAVWRDVATRIIPDGVSLALALAGLLSRAAGAGFEAAQARRSPCWVTSMPSRSSSSFTRRPTTASVSLSRMKVPTAEKAKTAPVA